MLRLAFAIYTMAAIILASQTPAAARICKRVCSGGVCWSDCSKLPGQVNATVKGGNQARSGAR